MEISRLTVAQSLTILLAFESPGCWSMTTLLILTTYAIGYRPELSDASLHLDLQNSMRLPMSSTWTCGPRTQRWPIFSSAPGATTSWERYFWRSKYVGCRSLPNRQQLIWVHAL